MKNSANAPLWSFFIILAASACQYESIIEPEVPNSVPVSVTSAKTWVSSFLQQGDNAKQRYGSSTFLWQQARLKTAKNGLQYVQVELDEGKNVQQLIFDPISKHFSFAPKRQVIVFADRDGEMHLEVMELTPTGEYAFSHQGFTGDDDYSGMQLLYSWKGEFIKGFRYEGGKLTGQLKQSTKSDSKARVQDPCETWIKQYLNIACTNYLNEAVVIGTTVYYKSGTPLPYPPAPNYSDPFSYNSCYTWNLTDAPYFFQVCSDYSGPGNPYDPFNPSAPINPSDLFNPTPGSGLLPLLELMNNKIGLYGPCPGLDGWRSLVDFKPPTQVIDKLARLAKYPNFSQPNPYYVPNDWYVQSIRNAAGSAINLDEFSVFMPSLPVIGGQQLGVNDFVNYVRLHINEFTAGSGNHFSTAANTGENEAGLWQSSNPLGTVISIDITGDNGSVIVSEVMNGYGSASWTFSTIHDVWNGDHPVSGTRMFGCYETNGGYIFYTKGADRLTNYFQHLTGIVTETLLDQEVQFTAADALWETLQTNMASFLQNNGVSNPQILPPKKNRPYWAGVKQALGNNYSLSTVPCNR